jgi:predicted amidohydrolase
VSLHPLPVAAVQYTPVPRDLPANVAATAVAVTPALAGGARLVVLPEMSLVGYDLAQLDDPAVWTSAADPRLDPLRDLARDAGATLVVGAPWRDADGTPRLASLVLGPDGSCTVAAKVHLHGREVEHFVPGDAATTVDVDGWRVALAVCFDAANPPHAAAAAAAGADLYAVSALYATGEEPRVDTHLAGTAARHGLPTLLANLGGVAADRSWTSCGLSGTWGADGTRRTGVDGTGTAVAADVLPR